MLIKYRLAFLILRIILYLNGLIKENDGNNTMYKTNKNIHKGYNMENKRLSLIIDIVLCGFGIILVMSSILSMSIRFVNNIVTSLK